VSEAGYRHAKKSKNTEYQLNILGDDYEKELE
jgi:hypothetical protein